MKKIFKITIILMLMLITMTLGQVNRVYAYDEDEDSIYGGPKQPESEQGSETLGYINPEVFRPNPTFEDGDFKSIAQKIVVIIRNIGIVLTVIILMAIGIKEMVSSVEEKMILKEALPGYLFGAFMVLTITTLPSLIFSIVKNFNNI